MIDELESEYTLHCCLAGVCDVRHNHRLVFKPLYASAQMRGSAV